MSRPSTKETNKPTSKLGGLQPRKKRVFQLSEEPNHLLKASQMGFTSKYLESNPFTVETDSWIAWRLGYWWKHVNNSLWPHEYKKLKATKLIQTAIINDTVLVYAFGDMKISLGVTDL